MTGDETATLLRAELPKGCQKKAGCKNITRHDEREAFLKTEKSFSNETEEEPKSGIAPEKGKHGAIPAGPEAPHGDEVELAN